MPYAFTKENAREMAQRSADVRRAAKLRAKEREALLAKLTDPRPLTDKQMRVERQMARLDDLLDDTDDPKEINTLCQAKERLTGIWCRLTGFPREGVRKVSKGRSSLPDLMPVVSPIAPGQSLPVNDVNEPNG